MKLFDETKLIRGTVKLSGTFSISDCNEEAEALIKEEILESIKEVASNLKVEDIKFEDVKFPEIPPNEQGFINRIKEFFTREV